jgi:hypothetical protein
MPWPLAIQATLLSRALEAGRALLVLLVVTAVSGCFSGKAYEGPARPESSVAFIYGHNRFFQSKMVIRQVDDQEPFLPMLNEAAVLPGKHTILFLYSMYDNTGCIIPPCRHSPVNVTATLEAEAGHKYQIEAEGGRDSHLWIDDTTTGKKVWQHVYSGPWYD